MSHANCRAMKLLNNWQEKLSSFTGLKSLFLGGPKFLDYNIWSWSSSFLGTNRPNRFKTTPNFVAKSGTMRAFAPKLNYSFQSSGMYSMQKFAFSLSLFPHLFALVALNFFFQWSLTRLYFSRKEFSWKVQVVVRQDLNWSFLVKVAWSVSHLYHSKYCMPFIDIVVQVVCRILVTKVFF